MVNLPMANINKAWYEASRRFGPYNGHPRYCVDWNLETGGDRDFGEPLVAPFNGIVINAFDAGGAWGRVVRVLGRTGDGILVVWMGAHLSGLTVAVGQTVQAGESIGFIGNADGRYAAHLHEQICLGEVPGPTVFGTDKRYNFVQPDKFYIDEGVDPELVRRVVHYDGE